MEYGVLELKVPCLLAFRLVYTSYYEEETDHDSRTDIQPERVLSDSGSGTGRDEGDDREIRAFEEGVSSGAQEDHLRRDDAAEHAGQAPAGGRPRGEKKDRESDRGTPEGESRTGQDDGSDGMDTAYERDSFAGRGDNPGGTYIQLSLFPSVEEQADIIRTVAAGIDRSAAFFVPDGMVRQPRTVIRMPALSLTGDTFQGRTSATWTIWAMIS